MIEGDAAEDRPNIFRYFSNVPVPIEVLTNDELGNDGPILVLGACVVIPGGPFSYGAEKENEGCFRENPCGYWDSELAN